VQSTRQSLKYHSKLWIVYGGRPIIPLFKRKTASQMVAVVFGGAPSGGQRHNNLGLSVPFVKHDAVVLSRNVKYFTLKPKFR